MIPIQIRTLVSLSDSLLAAENAMPPRKRKLEQPRPVDPPSESPDRISALPDDVLAAVLSFLPIKESVRTGILSSRWRHLWPLSSLNIDDSSLVQRSYGSGVYDPWVSFDNYAARSREIFSGIFSSHGGPFRSCRLSLLKWRGLYSTVDGFIETLTQRGIEDLDLRSCGDDYKLPGSIALCKSLSKLRLEYCVFFDPPFPSGSFQNLKDVRIDGGKLNTETIHCLLATCLRLESLDLSVHYDAGFLQVSSPTIRKLCLKFYAGWAKGITIVDTPNLKQLMLGETATFCKSFIVQNAPKLELLGFMAFESRLLQLGNSTFRRQEPQKLSEHCSITRPILINISMSYLL